METTDSNNKPQQTSGLKLMTVFIVVLAAHVVVIGGFTVYHLMNGGSADSELLADKNHKNVKLEADGTTASDGQLPDGSPADKTASTSPADSTGTAANTPASSTEQTPPSTESSTPSATAPTTVTTTTSQPTGPVHPGSEINPPQVQTPQAPTFAETAPPLEPAAGDGTPYVVKSHDSLAKIARQNHTTVAKLKTANGLNTDMLHIGQKLVIPARTEVAVSSVAKPDSTGSTTILGNSASTPSMNIPASAATTPVAGTLHEQGAVASGHHLYTVMKGDTLTKIAHKFKTTPTAIMTANNITDPAKLSIGKKLKIPSQESRSATNASAPATQQPSPVQEKAGPTGQLANFVQ